MMGVPLTSRAMVAAAAVPLLLLSAPQSSTAFVLRPASLSTLPERSVLERRSTTAAATTTNARSRARGRPRTAVALLISATNPKASREARLMMASEPIDEVPTAEEAAASEEPSIPRPEEGGVAAEDADATAEEAAEEGEEMPEAEEGETEVVAEEKGENEEAEEEEEEEVDPMAEVKERIKELEKQLILEENKLRDAQDSVQEKGQMGFLRMAAQVDNFRKTSGAGTGDYEADAKAAVLTAMLPAFEPFEAAEEALKMETENEIKFNKSYQALYRQLKDVYTKIGATDYFGVVGEKFVYTRHEKASEEHNPIMKEGLIIKCLSPGLELKKNVIRKAVCVVSLGPEKKPEEAKPEAEEGKEEAGDAPADAAAAAAASAEEGGAGGEVEGAEKEKGVVEEEAPPLRDAGAGGADADEDAEGEPTADA